MKSIKEIKYGFVVFLLITFILGIFFCLNTNIGKIEKETMANIDADVPQDTNCPNVLIRQGSKLSLYNSYQPVNEKNPIVFNNLDEYVAYTRTQRDEGLRCPVLYLQQENNAQGQDVYRVRPGPFSVEGGLPPKMPNPVKVKDASLQNPPYNKGQYSGFDPYNSQYVGVYTNLDQIHDSTEQAPISDNPMDTNWGGVIHSQQMIDSGKYDENTVGKPVMVPRVLALQP